MNYPVLIHKDRDSDYGVSVPDLPGCISAGSTIDQALAMVREAIELHLEGLMEAGKRVPRASTLEKLWGIPEATNGAWVIVSVDESKLRTKTRKAITAVVKRKPESDSVCDKVKSKVSGGRKVSYRYARDVAIIDRDEGDTPQQKRSGGTLRKVQKSTKSQKGRK